jgi:hypothetical protein
MSLNNKNQCLIADKELTTAGLRCSSSWQLSWSHDLPLREHTRAIRLAGLLLQSTWSAESITQGKRWTYCNIPDVVVGFVPNNNVYGIAQWLALYLSL